MSVPAPPRWQNFLTACMHRGALEPVHIHFADEIARLSADEENCDDLFLAATMASYVVAQGHSCLIWKRLAAELERLAAVSELELPDPLALPSLRKLQATQVLGTALADPVPLIAMDSRLYLRRYAAHEATLRDRFSQLRQAAIATPAAVGLDPARPPSLFEAKRAEIDWQQVACALAIRQRLLIIAGGPGTGKTYTIVRVMAALLAQATHSGARHSIVLCAPTGKAAQRISESVATELATVRPVVEALGVAIERLPTEATTLHRLLGMRPGRTAPARHADSPLAADTVIVDEASMVDLALMAKLAGALKPGARLVLVGDANQLLPVEAGSVFSELWSQGRGNGFSAPICAWIKRTTGHCVPPQERPAPLGDHVVELRQTHRFNREIAHLAAAINRGRVDDQAFFMGVAQRQHVRAPEIPALIAEQVQRGAHWYADLRNAKEPREALVALQSFKLLCAVRRGPFGVEHCNRAIEAALSDCHGVRMRGPYYHLMPIMIGSNDTNRQLFNGDVGVMFEGEDGLLAYFPGVDGAVRSYSPAALPAFECCYAMTIHKSQGSEFDAVTVILPRPESPILCRELLYTAVTRARSVAHIWAPEGSIQMAVSQVSERMSGPLID